LRAQPSRYSAREQRFPFSGSGRHPAGMPRRGHPQASTAFAVAFLAVLHVSSTAHGASPIHVIKLKAPRSRAPLVLYSPFAC